MEHNIIYISYDKWDQGMFMMSPVAIEILEMFAMKILFYSLGFSEVNDYISFYINAWQKLEYILFNKV